jgi:hypothetical protein
VHQPKFIKQLLPYEQEGSNCHTQFGRALYELNIDGMCANTPAAKRPR